jgi:hypothetical protein
VKTLLGSSRPAAVALFASFTTVEASSKLLRPEQVGDESPARMLISALLASADVNILLEGTTGAPPLRPLALYHRWCTFGSLMSMVPPCHFMVKLLIVPACAYVCSIAMVCPAAFDLAGVVASG